MTARARLDVRVTVDAPQELTHASHVLAGLHDLAAEGTLAGVRVGTRPRLHRGELHLGPDGAVEESRGRARKTTFLTVAHPGGRLRVAVDLRDAATIFPRDGLAADVCFKRSYLDGPVAAVVARTGATIRPAGLSFLARSPAHRPGPRLWAGLHGAAVGEALRPDRLVRARLRHTRRDARYAWHVYRTAFTTDRVRRPVDPAAPTDGTVLFQTRAFADEAGDAPALHAQRAALVRALRQHLGPRFRGGFVPDPFTRERFPDCLSDLDPRPDAYLDAVDRAAVVVSTRGLEGSAPHKLGEMLARGKALVAEPVAHRLPAPLEDGVHLRAFTDVDGCLAACDALLADPGDRAGLGAGGRAYFDAWVDPPAAVHRLLAEALALAGVGAAAP